MIKSVHLNCDLLLWQNAEAAGLHGADIKDMLEEPMKVIMATYSSIFFFFSSFTIFIGICHFIPETNQ